MRLEWWKILAVVLIIYVIIAGFLIPLKPGMVSVYPTKIEINKDQDFSIETYNTFHAQAKEVNVWLKVNDQELLKASKVDVVSDTKLKSRFFLSSEITASLDNSKPLTLIVDNEIDGYAIYPQAISIRDSDGIVRPKSNKLYPIDSVKKADSFRFPYRSILYETIRNTFFHVAIWFAMFLLLIGSCYYSIKYLIKKDHTADLRAESLITVALYFGIAGIITGSIWARFTWGTFWTADIKLNMSAVAMLVYLAYWVLRSSLSDLDTRARMSSVYNLFSFVCLMVLVMVIPRFTDSLHPGNGGNPALGGEDLDNTLRIIFYPAIIGYTLLGVWIAQVYYRFLTLKDKFDYL